MLAIFALMAVVLLGGAAFVTDAVWWWTFEQRMQRAADAAALAGAVHLPGRQDLAYQTAFAEAKKNGFDDALTNVVVMPSRDPHNERKLIVNIDAPSEAHFARVFGIQSVPVAVVGAAEFMPRVPMGSPENYYGVFGTLRGATFTSQVPTNESGESGWRSPTSATGFDWNNRTNAYSNNDAYAYTTTNGATQDWSGFGFNTSGIPVAGPNETLSITVEVRLTDAFVSDTCNNSLIRAQVSWNGTSFTSAVPMSTNLGIGTTSQYTLGGFSKSGGWTRNDFPSSFRVRLTSVKGCATGSTRINLDHLEVRYAWTLTGYDVVQQPATNDRLRGPGTPCANGAANCFDPDDEVLNERGFWATMNTRGASNVNGDAHQPYYDTAWSTVAPSCAVADDTEACHDPEQYYNYAVEMPPNSTGGYVYVFDPGFCATANNRGTGDRWFRTNARDKTAVSSWYVLYADDRRTPYNLSDDRVVVPPVDLFAELDASDATMGGGSDGADCRKRDTAYGDGRDYHLSWYKLNPDNPLTGGPRGTVYRIHTTGTDPGTPPDVITSDTDGEQSFALFAEAQGGTPRIYGLGSMQMFTPLSSSGGSTVSEFYLAQIGAAHAGRTVAIQLWDPGDTDPLRAGLQIMVPNDSGVYAPAAVTYTAAGGTSNDNVNEACNGNKRLTASSSSIATEATGSGPGEFNGCWLTILVHVDPEYKATQDGWWKIRYNMNGNGTSNDVTTWKVGILGNPVHLVPVGGG